MIDQLRKLDEMRCCLEQAVCCCCLLPSLADFESNYCYEMVVLLQRRCEEVAVLKKEELLILMQ